MDQCIKLWRRFDWIISFLFCCTIPVATTAQGIVVNEVMPANSVTISDEDGEFSDWIEIYNAGTDTINLSNYGLSDIDSLFPKWIFPPLTLNPDNYLIVYASGKNRTKPPLYWQTIINWGDEWTYIVPTQEPSADWNNLSFNDQDWSMGKSGFGYGDNDDFTLITTTMSVYIRKKFNISDTSNLKDAILHMDYDDSFVAYLNGEEIARGNIGTPGIPPTFNQGADNYNHEALIYRGLSPEPFRIDSLSHLVKEGENVLAIQVHNYSMGSSDLTAIPFLTVGLSVKPEIFYPVPTMLTIQSPLLHTNFKLNSDGETVYLYNTFGVIIDSIAFERMSTDISKGRYPDGSNNLSYFIEATPGNPNQTKTYSDISGDPFFSTQGGIFSNALSVYLTGQETDDTIYYTTDGNDPSFHSSIYTGPIVINSNTILRARIIEYDKIPGRIVTNSYLISTENSLPVISLTTSPENLWDFYDGMYVMGPDAETEFPHFGANFWQDWEKPVHIELFEQDGSTGFDIDAGMKIFGGWSRGFSQKSLSIFARSKYGYGSINYRIFDEKAINKFEAIVLRNSGNDWNYSMMRDGMMTGLVSKMDIDKQAYRPAEVYLNGEYWGILNIREKINEHFVASNHNLDADQIDLLEGNGWVIQGSSDHYFSMLDYVSNNDMKLDQNLEVVQSMMEIESFIKYQVSQIYFDNRDWPGNNIKFWRPQTEVGKWRWIMFDTDFGFGIWDPNKYSYNTLAFAMEPNGPNWPNPPWSTFLLRKLLENNRVKIDFINCFADHLNTTFLPEKVKTHILTLKNNIESEMPDHLLRWGGNYNNWENEIQVMINFGLNRGSYVRNHIWNRFSLSGMYLLNLDISPYNAGKIKVNTVIPESYPWSGTYFDHIPITLTPIADPGYRFTGWTGSIQSLSESLTIDATTNQQITANFEPDGSGLQYIVINEINYNSSEDFDTGDWIEIYNRENAGRDLTGWIFKDSDDGHEFVFPPNTNIGAEDYLIVCRDKNAFSLLSPSVASSIGDFDFGLSSSGEFIRLYDSSLQLVDSVFYGNSSPWPSAPNGNGPTLELINPALDNTLPQNWYASTTHGTPGAINESWSPLSIDDHGFKNMDELDVQIYPNPFSDFVTIQVNINQAESIKLFIQDLMGRIIDVLYEGELIEGIHEWKWEATGGDGNKVLPGLYFIRLETGSLIKTKKLVYNE